MTKQKAPVKTEHERIIELEQKVAKLEEIILQLRQPSYRPFPAPWKDNEIYGPITHQLNRCHKCGMHISGVMGYVCNQADCPTFVNTTSLSKETQS